jgi:hypothetical protein
MTNDNPRVITHKDSKGNVYTQEYWGNHAGCAEIVKDQYGRQINTSGSGGYRPWMG